MRDRSEHGAAPEVEQQPRADPEPRLCQRRLEGPYRAAHHGPGGDAHDQDGLQRLAEAAEGPRIFEAGEQRPPQEHEAQPGESYRAALRLAGLPLSEREQEQQRLHRRADVRDPQVAEVTLGHPPAGGVLHEHDDEADGHQTERPRKPPPHHDCRRHRRQLEEDRQRENCEYGAQSRPSAQNGGQGRVCSAITPSAMSPSSASIPTMTSVSASASSTAW